MTEKVVLPDCRGAEIWSTAYENLFVMKDVGAMSWLPKLDPRNVDITAQISNAAAYVLYESELLAQQINLNALKQLCLQRFYQNVGTPVQISGDNYAIIKGQILFLFACQEKTDTILETNVCFQDVPIQTNPVTYVEPHTLLRKNHSAIIPCDARFPLTVKTQGVWVSLSPKVALAVEPRKGPVALMETTNTNVIHENIVAGGLYTPAERRAWEELISYPEFNQAVLAEVVLGSCRSDGRCGVGSNSIQGVPDYDLRRLVAVPEEWNPWEILKRKIYENGALLSFLVILLTLGQWLINLTVMLYATIRGGPAVALAVIATLFCNGTRAYRQVRRRHRRQEELEERTAKLTVPELLSLHPVSSENL